MRLVHRRLRETDFDAVYKAWFERNGPDHPDVPQVIAEWKAIIRYPAVVSTFVEQVDGTTRIPRAHASAVFVTEDYAEYVTNVLPPYLNTHLIRPLPNGAQPLLPVDQMERAQRSGGLNALVSHAGWNTPDLDPHGNALVQDYLFRSFALRYRGYVVKNLLFQVIGTELSALAVGMGFRVIRDYDEWYREREGELPQHLRPYLLRITREEALKLPVTWAGQAFVQTKPRIGFSALEREMLEYAIEGLADNEIADAACVSLQTIRHRWNCVFKRVKNMAPELLPDEPEADGKRGREKRTAVVRYVSEYPEELRAPLNLEICETNTMPFPFPRSA
jgi:DNA-binding NarL/FixJ family response regulator